MMNAIATASRRIAARRPMAAANLAPLLRRASSVRWQSPPPAVVVSVRGGQDLGSPSAAVPSNALIGGGGGGASRRTASTRAAEEEEPPPRSSSSSSSSSAYAAVDHARSYEEALAGRHGRQLKLADDEGLGKDDPPYDPFDEPFFQALDRRHDEEDEEEDYDEEEEEGGVDEEEDDSADGDAPLSDDAVDEEYVDDDEDEEEEEYDEDAEGTLDRVKAMYNKDGSVRRPKSELAALRAGKPAGGLFAVIDLNGSQQKVTVDDVVIVNKLKPVSKWAVGNTLTLTGDEVLLMGSPETTLVGLPGVKGAEVDVMVEEITRDAKVIIFKRRRRKHSQRKKGFRREVTFLRVLDIRFPEQYSHPERGAR